VPRISPEIYSPVIPKIKTRDLNQDYLALLFWEYTEEPENVKY